MSVPPSADRGPSDLAPQHVELLERSAVDLSVARQAGVRSVTAAGDLPDPLGWVARHQHGVPGIVFPWHGPDGRVVCQYRPDQPISLALDDTLKYVWPTGAALLVWVHPRMARLDPDKVDEVVVVEGTKQYLAAVSAAGPGQVVVGISGCHGWMADGVPLADWSALPLAGRRAVVCFDADLTSNRSVWNAGDALGRHLRVLGAAEVAHVRLPAGRKAGLDDYLAVVPADGRPAAFARLLEGAGPIGRPPRQGTRDGDRHPPAPEPEADTFDDVADEPLSVVLDGIAGFLARHVVYSSGEARDAVVLWIAHTWVFDRFDSTPRLALLSPEKRCGKTRVLELVDLLARETRHTVSMSPSYLFRLVEDRQPTLLLDEADALWGRNASSEHGDLRALVNAGHRSGAVVGRVEGEGAARHPAEYQTFCPVALAGIGDCLPDTVLDRAVVVRMRRRAPGEQVEPLRRRRAEQRAAALARRFAAWAYRHGAGLADAEPDLPVEDRAADVWEPLVAIADAAGGDWPERARAACKKLAADTGSADGSHGVRLLADLHGVFNATGAHGMHSVTLVAALNALEESPWSAYRNGQGLNTYTLAGLLGGFGIRSTNLRIEGKQRKGYLLTDFNDAFARYLADTHSADTPGTSVHPSHPHPNGHESPGQTRWDGGTDGAGEGDVGRMRGRDEASPQPSRATEREERVW